MTERGLCAITVKKYKPHSNKKVAEVAYKVIINKLIEIVNNEIPLNKLINNINKNKDSNIKTKLNEIYHSVE